MYEMYEMRTYLYTVETPLNGHLSTRGTLSYVPKGTVVGRFVCVLLKSAQF